ncbi:MAG: hypothetical protein HC806_06515 [Anaerolineae bacterium]|nr:hypothetical protein [Anaerolineae bacterium]
MPEEITPELFNHLVELAALELTSEESEYLRRELNRQLASIHTLAAIPIPDDVEPARAGFLILPQSAHLPGKMSTSPAKTFKPSLPKFRNWTKVIFSSLRFPTKN